MTDTADSATTATEWPDLPQADMLERIIAIIIREGKVDPALILPSATLESLGMMSIDVVSVLMGVEEEFDAYLPMTSELSEARNLRDLIDVIARQMRPDDLGTSGATA